MQGELSRIPILLRGHAGALLEEADEMLGIFETEAFCHLVDRQTLVVELFLGGSEQVVVDEVLCRAAGLRFHQLSEVAC